MNNESKNSTKPATSFAVLPRMELLMVMLLTLMTLGTYTYYWLYTRTKILNQLCPEYSINKNFVSLCLVGFFVLMAVLFSLPEANSIEELQNSPAYDAILSMVLILNTLLLVWGLLFCQRLNHLSQAHKQDALYARYSLLVFVHLLAVNTLYLQYKINQLIDSQRVDIM